MKTSIEQYLKSKSIVNPTLTDVASFYIGQKELKNNSGFQSATFESKLREVGWQMYQAWCSYFTELVVSECAQLNGNHIIHQLATKLFSGSSTKTYKNFELEKEQNVRLPFIVSESPIKNSVGIFRYGNTWKGHSVIINDVNSRGIIDTIEGNTNLQGSREGTHVLEKTRATNVALKKDGLNFIGCIAFSI